MLGRRWCWLLLISPLAAGCGKLNTYVEPPPPEVTVTTPVERDVTEYLEFSGMTQPMETVEIRARVKGFLKERHFVEGSTVRQGQLLLVIDEEPFQIQLDAAKMRLKEAEAALQQATVSRSREVARAQVKLNSSQVHLARQEEQRLRSLSQRKISTEAEMEQAIATREAREAELESAKANLDQAVATYDTTILSCEAQVESAKIAVRNAELDLGYCRMTSPIDGRISRVNFDIGNLVGDGQSSVLATIVKLDPIYAYATVSEADVLRTPSLMKLNEESSSTQRTVVELGLPSQTGFPITGTLDYTDPSLDSSTGTLRVRGVFPNAEYALLPGLFVQMRIPVAEKPKALLVPERSLGTDQSGQYVLVVDGDGKVEYRPVRIGVAIDDWRVVEGSLAVTDQVIVEGLLRARPGFKVTPKPKAAPNVTADHHLTGRR
ncbi:MAG: efflux RND transporter periplasmic adaptor subunit [Planctomycetaceae bacterium]